MLIQKIISIDRLQIGGFSEEENIKITEKLENILLSWLWTPYKKGKGMKGVEVDCVHFLTGVYDELLGTKHEYISLPADASFHNKETVSRGLRVFLEMYPSIAIQGDIVQPGDMIICGPAGKNGGPGHGMIVGKDTLWHVGSECVCKAGLGIFQQGTGSFKEIRRLKDRTQLRRCL